MRDFNSGSEKEQPEIDIDTISKLYGNRRTVVETFLTTKSEDLQILDESPLSVYDYIEIELGYPVPSKLKKRRKKDSKN